MPACFTNPCEHCPIPRIADEEDRAASAEAVDELTTAFARDPSGGIGATLSRLGRIVAVAVRGYPGPRAYETHITVAATVALSGACDSRRNYSADDL